MNAGFLKCALIGITTEQFATIFEPKSDDFGLNLSVSVKSNYLEHKIGLGLSVKMEEKGKVFIQIETTCHYLIEENEWMRISDNMQKDVVLPEAVIRHLISLSIGVTRGVLHGRTENTPYNKYVIPLIDIDDMIKGKGDAVIRKE